MPAPQPLPPTVVVIDDDPDIRAGVSDLLQDAGYQVVCHNSCNTALAHMCQHPPPGLVLVDLLMPGMNAWELVAQMKRRDFLASVPVIAMTGMARPLGSPVSDEKTLRKPIDPARLLDVVRDSVKSAS